MTPPPAPTPAAAPPVALPKVSLRGKTIPVAVLLRIPLATAERYQVVCFEETATALKLAIVYPEQLKQGFYVAVRDLGTRMGRSIELFQTDAASLRTALQQYAPPTPKRGSAAPLPVLPPMTEQALTTSVHPPYPRPPLFELGKSVAFSYLRRVPIDFAKEHRVLCVDFLQPDLFWFAVDSSAGEKAIQVLCGIEAKNHIRIVPLPLASTDFTELLGYYEQRERERQNALVEQATHTKVAKKVVHQDERVTIAQPAETQKEAREGSEFERPEMHLAADVLIPDAQAAILTSEEERGGLAGIFQRINQTSVAERAAPVLNTDEVSPEPSLTAPPASPATAPSPAATTGAPTPPPPPGTAAVVAPPAPVAEKKRETQESEDGDLGSMLQNPVQDIEELKAIVRKGFIPRLVAAVVSFAIHEKASDIHIEGFEDEVRVRYRIDGQLMDVVKLAPDVHAAMVSRIKILARLRLDESRVPQDGRFDVSFENARVDLRVSVMPTVHGEKVVMRLLDKDKSIVSLEGLGVQGLAFRNLIDAISKPFGICLATGPTGSGKSTTLYAILNRIATPNVNVITLEDPVEFEMKGVNQVQVRPRIGFTFAEGLRAVLRQDPNVIMVGEIRDGETANMATQAALTGHLVLSTLHTNDAAGAIPRLTNMGIEPFLITSSLNCAMGQRLVRKVCPNCKQPVGLPPSIRQKIEGELAEIKAANPLDAKRVPERFEAYQGTGCAECGGTGYKGRLGIYEVLVMNEELEALTLKHAAGSEMQQAAKRAGMLTMYQDGLLKVAAGITTLDEVLRESTSK